MEIDAIHWVPALLTLPFFLLNWRSKIPTVGPFLEGLTPVWAFLLTALSISILGNFLFHAIHFIFIKLKTSFFSTPEIIPNFSNSPAPSNNAKIAEDKEFRLQAIKENEYALYKFGDKLTNVATALAAKKLKRQKKGRPLSAYVVDHSNFDAFLNQIKLQKNQLTKGQKLNFQFVFRIRGKDYEGRHFVCGEVMATPEKLDFLVIDSEGAYFPELLGEHCRYRPWHTNDQNFIEKIHNTFKDMPNFNLLTSVETLQHHVYGCGYFSIFGCFDLSSMKPRYMQKEKLGSYASIFEYMKDHEIEEKSGIQMLLAKKKRDGKKWFLRLYQQKLILALMTKELKTKK